jgi:hypothetical protein
MKILIAVTGVIVATVLLMVVVGFLLPREHIASVQASYRTSPSQLYTLITDIENGPSWRTGLQKVEILSSGGEPLRWRETADWGTITFVRDVSQPHSRVVHRIADESEGFGGTWTYEIQPDGAGSRLTITERGIVYNPVFRFLSKFVFGHYRSLETYAQDLARRLEESVTTTRL